MLSPSTKTTKMYIERLVNLVDGHPRLASEIKIYFPKTMLTEVYHHAIISGIAIQRTKVSSKRRGQIAVYYMEKDRNLAFEMITNKFGKTDWKNFGRAILDGEMPNYREADKKLQIYVQVIRRNDKYAEIRG